MSDVVELTTKYESIHDIMVKGKYELAKIVDVYRTKHGLDENMLKRMVWSAFMLSKRWPRKLPELPGIPLDSENCEQTGIEEGTRNDPRHS